MRAAQAVPKEPATFGTHAAIGIHANHSAMAKSRGDESSGYTRITAELARWSAEIEKERQAPPKEPVVVAITGRLAAGGKRLARS